MSTKNRQKRAEKKRRLEKSKKSSPSPKLRGVVDHHARALYDILLSAECEMPRELYQQMKATAANDPITCGLLSLNDFLFCDEPWKITKRDIELLRGARIPAYRVIEDSLATLEALTAAYTSDDQTSVEPQILPDEFMFLEAATPLILSNKVTAEQSKRFVHQCARLTMHFNDSFHPWDSRDITPILVKFFATPVPKTFRSLTKTQISVWGNLEKGLTSGVFADAATDPVLRLIRVVIEERFRRYLQPAELTNEALLNACSLFPNLISFVFDLLPNLERPVPPQIVSRRLVQACLAAETPDSFEDALRLELLKLSLALGNLRGAEELPVAINRFETFSRSGVPPQHAKFLSQLRASLADRIARLILDDAIYLESHDRLLLLNKLRQMGPNSYALYLAEAMTGKSRSPTPRKENLEGVEPHIFISACMLGFRNYHSFWKLAFDLYACIPLDGRYEVITAIFTQFESNRTFLVMPDGIDDFITYCVKPDKVMRSVIEQGATVVQPYIAEAALFAWSSDKQPEGKRIDRLRHWDAA